MMGFVILFVCLLPAVAFCLGWQLNDWRWRDKLRKSPRMYEHPDILAERWKDAVRWSNRQSRRRK